MSPWREVSLDVPAGLGEALAALLDVDDRASVATTPGGAREFVTVWFAPDEAERADALRRDFEAWRRRDARGAAAGLRERDVAPRAEPGWSRPLTPFRVGRVCVVDAERPPPATRPDDVVVPVVAGSAFGTGRHATTRTCLRVLQDLVRPGDSVLDAGCGTGILGVAAVLCGAASAHLLDDDPACAAAARALVARTGLGARCEVSTAAVPTHSDTRWPVGDARHDGQIANIEHDVIAAGAPALAAALAPGGWFVVSGLRTADADDVAVALVAAGLEVTVRHAAGARFAAYSGRASTTGSPDARACSR